MTAKEIQKYQKKSIPELIKIATLHFNKFIRERDKGQPCISCGAEGSQAGHYYSAGHFSSLRFDEDNVHLQCTRCNLWLHGNLIGYNRGLHKKIGDERVARLDELSHRHHKWDRFTLIDIILKYK